MKRILFLTIAALLGMFTGMAAETTENVLWKGYSPSGESFLKTVDFNKDTQTIRAEIDLSTCRSSTTYENYYCPLNHKTSCPTS